MNEFDELFAEWDRLLFTAMQDGCISGGTQERFRAYGRRLVENALRKVYAKSNKWTKRCDDAKRIPDMIYDFIDAAKDAACEAELRAP